MCDLSSNFIFLDDDIGNNQSLAWFQKRHELNNDILVSAMSEFNALKLSKFQTIFFIDTTLDKVIQYDKFCHANQLAIAFCKAKF